MCFIRGVVLPVVLVVQLHSLLEEIQFGYAVLIALCVRSGTYWLAFHLFIEAELKT